MKSDVKKDTLYLCDPQKNTECPKGNCQIPDGCFLTIKKEFAVTDENEKPTKEESYKVKMPNSCCHAGNTGRKETKMTKAEIKRLAADAGLYLWQIAEKLGINDSNFSRKLRRPLSEADTAKVLAAIEQLTAEQENIK